MRIAVITGASSGLGREFVLAVARDVPAVDELWLVARRADRLEALQAELPQTKIRPLLWDLSDTESFSAYQKLLEIEKPTIAVLVNNAGFGKLGNVAELPYDEQINMIDVNNRALTAISCLSLPYMTDGSFMVNVASIAAFAPNPRLTVYSSTKAYVFSFSKGLRYELKPRHINVLAVCPGPMSTEFMKVAGIGGGNSRTFDILPYCHPETVARKALQKAAAGRAVYTNRIFFKVYRVLSKLLPHNWIMPVSKA